MSFGYGIGDILATAQLANTIRKRFSDAPKQFNELLNELRSLSIVLQDVDILVDDSGPDAKLGSIVTSCNTILTDIQKTLEKHIQIMPQNPDSSHLGTRMKRTWKRLTWEPDDARDLRSRLISNIELLNVYISSSTSINTLAIRRQVDKVASQQELDIRRKLLSWISDIDYEANHVAALASRLEETSWNWVMNEAVVAAWLNRQNRILLCTAAPGIGKTVMSAVLIDCLQKRIGSSKDCAVIHVFFNYNRQNQQKVDLVFSNLLLQLLHHGIEIPTSLWHQLVEYESRSKKFNIKEVLIHINTCLASFTSVSVVFDALDECEEDCRNEILEHMFQLQESNKQVCFFATSRPLPNITGRFSEALRFTLRANDEDMRRFLADKGQKIAMVCKDSALLEILISETLKAADGVFLLARLHFDLLRSKRTLKSLKGAIADLPKGSTAYDVTYEQVLSRIQEQQADARKQAMNALLWIVCAKQQLSCVQIQHALAIDDSEDEFEPENIPNIDSIVSDCLGLVEVDEKTNIIRLVHFTAREFFDRYRARIFPNADRQLAQLCTKYISFVTVAAKISWVKTIIGLRRSSPTSRMPNSPFPLHDYIRKHWADHLRRGGHQFEDARSVFEHQDQIDLLALTLKRYARVDVDTSVTPITTALHLSVWFGLESCLKILLEQSKDLDTRDVHGDTALQVLGRSYPRITDASKMLYHFASDSRVDFAAKDSHGSDTMFDIICWDRMSKETE